MTHNGGVQAMIPLLNVDDALPAALLDTWQTGLDLLAALGEVKIVAVSRVFGGRIEILRMNTGGEAWLAQCSRDPALPCLCDHVNSSGDVVHVRDVPAIGCLGEGNLRPGAHASYLGYPLRWPDGRPFGTLFAMDTRANEFSGLFRRQIEQVVRAMTAELAVLDENNRLHAEAGRRRAIERALRESEERLREAQQLARIGHWHLDMRRNRLEWSDEIFRIFEIDKSRFGASYEAFLQLVHPDDREALDSHWQRSVVDGSTYEFEHRLLLPDGRIKWVTERGTTRYDSDGTALVSLGTVQDITERHQAARAKEELERRLLHSQKLESLGVMAGGIAHDFNNILQAVIGNLELIVHCADDDASRDALVRARQGAIRAADVTRQLLAFAGRDNQPRQRLDLDQVVEESTNLMRVVVSKRITLRHVPAHRALPVEAVPGQLQQVLMNLVTNAADAIGDARGSITVACGEELPARLRHGRYWPETPPAGTRLAYLEVSDSGSGMDADTLAHLFDPFFTTKAHGRGLGMPSVLGIVRAHRGAMQVNSEKGRGTQVRILLPLASPVADAVLERRDAPAIRTAALHVLLVDDEESIRIVGQALLERAGMRVTCAADGEEAIARLGDGGPMFDCVVLDLTMPGIDGAEVYRYLRGAHPGLPVLLASGFDYGEAMRRIEMNAVTGFVRKPWRGEDIVAAIHALLQRSA